MMILNIALVAFGGAFGSICRYLIFESINHTLGSSNNHLATILINVVGSFLAGIIYFFTSLNETGLILHQVRLLIMAGFLGGFTTFSAFSVDILKFIDGDKINIALCYTLLSVMLSIIAVLIGFYLAHSLNECFK